MNKISQTRLGDAGLNEFRTRLRKVAGVTIRRIKEEGFCGINSKCYVWRWNNITLFQSRLTMAYVAVENYTWDEHRCIVISIK